MSRFNDDFETWLAAVLALKVITPAEADRFRHSPLRTKVSLRGLIVTEGFTFPQAERVLTLTHTHDLSRSTAKLVVRGHIPLERAITRTARKAMSSGKSNKPVAATKKQRTRQEGTKDPRTAGRSNSRPISDPGLAPFRHIVTQLKKHPDPHPESGDIYEHGRRLPGSYGNNQ